MKRVIFIIFAVLLFGYCASQKIQNEYSVSSQIAPPVAKKIPTSATLHNIELKDNYAWMIDDTRSDSTVIEYIEAENAYADAIFSEMATLKDTIFHEIISRIGEEDVNAPTRWGDYYYYSRREQGKPYKREYFNYLLSWDTYRNIRGQAYPNMMLTAGYHDSRVR
jgi:Protease II